MKEKAWWYFHSPELFTDEPYDEKAWCKHHSWVRHAPQPKVLFSVIKTQIPVLLWVALISTFVCLYAYFLQPKGWPIIATDSYLQPFIILSFAVSLLLVFRTNSSYARWWEARKAFGYLYHVCRDLARMAVTYLPDTRQPNAVSEFIRWNCVVCPALCAFIQQDEKYWAPVVDLLTEAELKAVKEARQPPVAVLQVMSRIIARADISDYQRMALEQRITALDLCIGSAERISRQPIPIAYTRHTSRLLITFLTFLPFALWEGLQWLTIPVTMVMTFLLVGIENIGIQIEEPFYVLPLNAFSMAGRKSIEEVYVQHKMSRSLAKGLSTVHLNKLDKSAMEERRNGIKLRPPRPPTATAVGSSVLPTSSEDEEEGNV